MRRRSYGGCRGISLVPHGTGIGDYFGRKWQVYKYPSSKCILLFKLNEKHIFIHFSFVRQKYFISAIRLGGGTTWHASGLVGAFKPSLAQVKLAQDSIALYKELEKKGLSTGWKQCGSLSLARTRDRMTSFRRMKAQSV